MDNMQPHWIGGTVAIVQTHMERNSVPASDLPSLITSVYGALSALGAAQPAIAEPEHIPAVSIKKSLADPHKIISMIDGRLYAMLRRHLKTNGLTPEGYRKRYGLPDDYPMTAPGYSEHRRNLALKIGLGRKPGAKA